MIGKNNPKNHFSSNHVIFHAVIQPGIVLVNRVGIRVSKRRPSLCPPYSAYDVLIFSSRKLIASIRYGAR